MKKENVILSLLASDFINTDYLGLNDGDCAIEKAAKRQFNAKRVNEVVTWVTIDALTYEHQTYSDVDFSHDEKLAESFGFDSSVVRQIELIPYGNGH